MYTAQHTYFEYELVMENVTSYLDADLTRLEMDLDTCTMKLKTTIFKNLLINLIN